MWSRDGRYVEHDDLEALNLHSRHANAFDDESEHVRLLFAHASQESNRKVVDVA